MSKKEKGSLCRQPIPDEEYVETAAELLAGLFLRQVQCCQERKGAKTKEKRSLKDKS